MKGEWDNGNGSLMRIAPLSFCDATDDEVRDVSGITHAHHVSYETCVEFVHVLRHLAVFLQHPHVIDFALLAAALQIHVHHAPAASLHLVFPPRTHHYPA